MSAIQPILTSMLTVLSTALWPSLVQALLLSYLYLYCYDPVETGKGLWAATSGWVSRVRSSRRFRRLLVCMLYGCLIMQGTLLGRSFIANPLANVVGGWRLWRRTEGGIVLVTSTIENLVMLLPLTFSFLWACEDEPSSTNEVVAVLLWSAKVALCMSLAIEALQLLLHLGTWQLSDLAYNTLGGVAGGLLWWVARQLKRAE